MSGERTGLIADFFKNERGRMVAFVRRLIDDAADRDGEDIVQDVMAGLFDAADVTVPFERLAAYVYASLRNRVVDMLRRRRGEESLDAPDAGGGPSLGDLLADVRYDAQAELERKDMRERLFSAIDTLAPDQRAIIIQTELEGLSFREIAEESGVPIGTLLARKSRAMGRLRNALGAVEPQE
jgi:RNA polymerase sigma factor (sigma-70 family)